jgi:hypothetical protein
MTSVTGALGRAQAVVCRCLHRREPKLLRRGRNPKIRSLICIVKVGRKTMKGDRSREGPLRIP